MNRPSFDDPAAASLTEIRAALDAGHISSVELVDFYLDRIDAIDRSGPALNSIIAVNAKAREEAQRLDAERSRGAIRGALHGVPLLIKDNIETADPMTTTAGSLALAQNLAGRDAPCVARLRAAGAIVLGKANLSEWANIRSAHSISGWSAMGGLVKNPHVLDRSCSGSSSGSGAAIAAGLATAALGTETDGSVVGPASLCGVVGLKPTVGLVSRTHLVPISASQDTIGPMTKSVADTALLLTIMAGRDRADRSTASADKRRADYVSALSPHALRGARLGVWRPRRMSDASFAVFDAACEAMRKQGAELIALEKFRTPKGLFANEFQVFLTELKSGLNAYLATTPATVASRSLADLIAFNRSEPRELALFGQDLFEAAEATRGLDDKAYKKALASSRRMARRALDGALAEHRLDAIVTITAGPSWRIDRACGDGGSGESSTLPAVAGYPHLTLPMGDVMGLPVGLSFIGPAWSEARLLALGHAFECATQVRKMPGFVPSLEMQAGKAFSRVAPSL